MIYPNDFESKIGFSIIRDLISRLCDSELGRNLLLQLKFLTNPNVIRQKLGEVSDLKNLIVADVTLPHFSVANVAQWLKEVTAPGAFLGAQELFDAAITFKSMAEIHAFFNTENRPGFNCKFLRNVFKDTPVLDSLQHEILRCVEKDGNVKDNASPRLAEIRRSIDNMAKSMHRIIRRVIDSSAREGIVEKDATPVIRDGRMVIPVSASNKRNLPGIVHDTSATGKTVFIEPAEVVEAGNHLRELQKEEEQEIIAILTYLTDLLKPHQEEIEVGCQLMGLYDFIKAKALFAIETGGEMPVIESKPELDWFHAVHPGLLLTLKAHNREAVAMNLKLDDSHRILIISGPNAGGKSVALKTVGIVQYMMQCGILPTIYSNSHMGVFANIFIDIGDEQSIENDLSTYSSHLANMKFFLKNANNKTLILADEIGSGTEPQIGAALAQAILQELGRSGCFGVLTTHYQNLKVFADNEPGFINGAMMYDRQLLRPTFQLSVGEPGSSFALEIAGNIGLPKNVIEAAKKIVGSEYVDSERFILDIQRDKRYWKNKRLEIKEKENKLNKLLEDYEAKAEDLKHQRASIIKEARMEAKEILQGANTKIERSIHEIRKSQADKEKAKAVRKELDEYKKSLDAEPSADLPDALKPLKHKSKKKKFESSKPSCYGATFPVVFSPGDFVKMENSGISGQIISIEGDKAEVAFGNLRTTIETKKLVAAKKPTSVKSPGVVFTSSSVDSGSRERQLNFKNEIDVRGFRADEALQAITYFIDDAVQFNAKRVRILHGTGHGILRSLIREQLKSNSHVIDFHDEDVRFGGAGITVVTLD